jgi:hypothetical protein
MDYEKAYNKALERAKKWYNAPNADKIPTYANRIIVEIFPELKESEDDKIRKALVRFHKSTIDVDGIKGEEIVAWLEKQGEKKYTWSDEDKKRIDRICDFVWKNRKGDTDEIYQQEQDVNWLKSLKERIGG